MAAICAVCLVCGSHDWCHYDANVGERVYVCEVSYGWMVSYIRTRSLDSSREEVLKVSVIMMHIQATRTQ